MISRHVNIGSHGVFMCTASSLGQSHRGSSLAARPGEGTPSCPDAGLEPPSASSCMRGGCPLPSRTLCRPPPPEWPECSRVTQSGRTLALLSLVKLGQTQPVVHRKMHMSTKLHVHFELFSLELCRTFVTCKIHLIVTVNMFLLESCLL